MNESPIMGWLVPFEHQEPGNQEQPDLFDELSEFEDFEDFE